MAPKYFVNLQKWRKLAGEHSVLRMAVQNVENQQQMVKEVTVKEAVMKNPVQNENVQEHFTSK